MSIVVALLRVGNTFHMSIVVALLRVGNTFHMFTVAALLRAGNTFHMFTVAALLRAGNTFHMFTVAALLRAIRPIVDVLAVAADPKCNLCEVDQSTAAVGLWAPAMTRADADRGF